mmetsp:Transcript_30872/g.41563  ORF Transcript_30872/g.41563 Transcript_30872/m.41563 type:complete len:233 (+) Transcript_30872:44-742(+)
MLALNLVCVEVAPGAQMTCPRTMALLSMPRQRRPTVYPAGPSGRSVLNMRMPVTTDFWGFLPRPRISISSPFLTIPCSTRPVATVPRPGMEKTSSTASRKGLSVSRSGRSTYSSTVSMSSKILSHHLSSPFLMPGFAFIASRACNADPWMKGVSSPGNPYWLSISRVSSSTSSNNSSSSMTSTLFMKHTSLGTPTCFDKRMCSRVWAIGPSGDEMTRTPPSIWQAPVIMFLT